MSAMFEGMDPYLEDPDIWSDFQAAFACEISKELNSRLPLPYYSMLGRRAAVDDEIPLPLKSEKLRHHYVDVRDSTRGHQLVTLIEIVSPSNKRPGSDRDDYLAKQQEVLASDASLIEIDLLRTGSSVVGGGSLTGALNFDPPAQYVVGVCRAWTRGHGAVYQAFPFTLRDSLPCVPVPLREGEPEIPLDLQFVFRQTYDRGPYRRGAVDCHVPPQPPLDKGDDVWAAGCVERTLQSRQD